LAISEKPRTDVEDVLVVKLYVGRILNDGTRPLEIESTRVAHAMTRAPLTLPAGTRLSRAAALFADHKVGAIPIVDDKDRLVGVVSYTDVLRAVVGAKPSAS
jgi:acetoin utilization protein AcuB